MQSETAKIYQHNFVNFLLYILKGVSHQSMAIFLKCCQRNELSEAIRSEKAGETIIFKINQHENLYKQTRRISLNGAEKETSRR